jgi:hypothetical protein
MDQLAATRLGSTIDPALRPAAPAGMPIAGYERLLD